MKNYLKRNLKAFVFGMISYFFLYFINRIYWKILISSGIININFNESLGTQTWNSHPLLIISTIVSVLIIILPGYITGWFSKQNSTFNGFILILICASIKFFASDIHWEQFHYSLSVFVSFLRPWFESLILPVSVGAMCGAAGKYHAKLKKGL